MTVFSVQDETGTVTQLTLGAFSPALTGAIAVGDTGLYEGYPDDGNASAETPVFQSLTFKVCQVLDQQHFSVQTDKANMADWPANGLITWQTGENATEVCKVVSIDGANAYIDKDFFTTYHTSRGNAVPPGAADSDIQAAIVKATDYLDQRYRYAGTKLLHTLSGNAFDHLGFGTWLFPYSYSRVAPAQSTTTQSTEWPRRDVIDNNGNTVRGIPKAIKEACAELAIRVLNGTSLQPDYDPNLVGAGGVVRSVLKKIGPLETQFTYDTQNGIGFFATFPQVDRMLAKAGLLYSGGGRTTFR